MYTFAQALAFSQNVLIFMASVMVMLYGTALVIGFMKAENYYIARKHMQWFDLINRIGEYWCKGMIMVGIVWAVLYLAEVPV